MSPESFRLLEDLKLIGLIACISCNARHLENHKFLGLIYRELIHIDSLIY